MHLKCTSLLDTLYDQRAQIWGDWIANAARCDPVDLHRLHADTMAMTFAGQHADQPVVEGVPHLLPGDTPQGEWVKPLKHFALAAGDGGLEVWFDTLDGGTGVNLSPRPSISCNGSTMRVPRQKDGCSR